MKIYNSHALTKHQRFLKAIAYGVPAALVAAIAYGLISRALRIEFSLVYLGIGYFIGYVIRTYGRGVQPRFSFLGAGLAVVAILLGDMISIFGLPAFYSLANFTYALTYVLRTLVSTNINSLLRLLFRAGAVYFAYTYSRTI